MKSLRKILVLTIAIAMMVAGMVISTGADTTTDLESMKVYAVDASGNKTEIPINFNSTTYSYDLTVKSTIASIEIEATPADSTSTWSVEKDGINTKMDFGTNLTVVDVTSASGAVNKYTLNTKKLTAEEEATYEDESTGDNAENTDETAEKSDKDKTVKVGKKKMKITSSFSDDVIPEGFTKTKEKYDGTKYSCIKGEVKELTAFYLYNDDTEGFYIYDSENDKFYKMSNIKIKSRMYTIVQSEETDGLLKNYATKKIDIVDEEVKAWVLDEDQGMYLVYAMNWDGDTNLYCYDDNEKCFQRYIVSADANSQVEAANEAYDNLQDKYNRLVDKYNILLKILCVLVVLIIILIFIIFNLALNKKEKKIKSKADGEYFDGEDDEDDLEELETSSVPETVDETEDSEETENSEDSGETSTEEETPTFNLGDISDKEFYGGEIDEEDEVLIDISDDEIAETVNEEEEAIEEDVAETPEEPQEELESIIDKEVLADIVEEEEADDIIEEEDFDDIINDDEEEIEEEIKEDIAEVKEAEQETESDLKETLKSMLPDDSDDDDDDDDFEFIDLN